MKKVMLVLLACSMSYALNAPYLISATALSDSSVGLSWRNNDAATTGFIIQRKDSTETVYQFIDSVKSPTQLTYTDLKNLRPSTLYTYQLISYNATEVSDTSNSVQVTTMAIPQYLDTFNQPGISVYWSYDTSNSVKMTIADNSNCEIGYRIYRDEGFTSSFNMISDIISANPRNRGNITWFDNAVSPNKWYNYKVAAYKSDSSIFSAPCSTFTFRRIQVQNLVRFQKLSDFPVSINSTCWSARAGDSIILKENPSPSGMFTVINVSNAANPQFAGYIDSTTARSYPLKTLIPVYLKYGVSNSYTNRNAISCQDKFIILRNSFLLRVDSSNLIVVDSTVVKGQNILPLNDSTIGFPYDSIVGTTTNTIFARNFYALRLSSGGFSSFPVCNIGWEFPYIRVGGMGTYISYSYRRPYVHGIHENTVLLSSDLYSYTYSHAGGGPTYEQIITGDSLTFYGMPSGVMAKTIRIYTSTWANAYNTGHYFSPTENLCTNAFPFPVLGYNGGATFYFVPGGIPTEIFVSDIRDPYPRSTAQSNNAIYIDAVHLQNQLQNILLDTLNNRVFLIFTNNMSILGYNDSITTGVASHAGKLPSSRRLVILPSPVLSGVTIVLPNHSRSADLYFYDISGRVIDKMVGVTSNAVLWRPRTRSMSCYIVMVKSGVEKYTAKFMVR